MERIFLIIFIKKFQFKDFNFYFFTIKRNPPTVATLQWAGMAYLPSGAVCSVGSIRSVGIATIVRLVRFVVTKRQVFLRAHPHSSVVGIKPHRAVIIPFSCLSVQWFKIRHFLFPFFFIKKFRLLWLGLVPINIIIP